MLVIAFVDQARGGRGLDDRALDLATALVPDLSALAREHRPVAVLKIGDRVRKGSKRDGVRSQEHLTSAVSDGERRPFACADQEVVVSGKQECQRESAPQLLERGRDCIGRRLAVLNFQRHQMSNGLGVGFADKFAAFFGQLLAQLAEIFDDPVVDDRNDIGGMRMSIVFGRPAVGCPAGVTDPDIASKRLALEPRFKRTQLAFRATAAKHAVVERGDTRGVIASVLEAFQGIDQLLGNRLGSQNSDNSAHPSGWPLCPSLSV